MEDFGEDFSLPHIVLRHNNIMLDESPDGGRFCAGNFVIPDKMPQMLSLMCLC